VNKSSFNNWTKVVLQHARISPSGLNMRQVIEPVLKIGEVFSQVAAGTPFTDDTDHIFSALSAPPDTKYGADG
jgi:hypothetical protein